MSPHCVTSEDWIAVDHTYQPRSLSYKHVLLIASPNLAWNCLFCEGERGKNSDSVAGICMKWASGGAGDPVPAVLLGAATQPVCFRFAEGPPLTPSTLFLTMPKMYLEWVSQEFCVAVSLDQWPVGTWSGQKPAHSSCSLYQRPYLSFAVSSSALFSKVASSSVPLVSLAVQLSASSWIFWCCMEILCAMAKSCCFSSTNFSSNYFAELLVVYKELPG